jgi:hypothetical protein
VKKEFIDTGKSSLRSKWRNKIRQQPFSLDSHIEVKKERFYKWLIREPGLIR